jgi:uncharacterized protein (TIGR03437 family)
VISGRLGAAGTSTFTLTVTDGYSTASAQLTLTIAPAPLIITSGSPTWVQTIGQFYYGGFSASGGVGPYSGWVVTSGSLPPGLSLSSADGVLSGTPSETGDYSFTVQVSDSTGVTTSKAFHLTVQSPSPYLSAVRDSASYGAVIAQGSMFVLFGESLGPNTLVQASTLPLPMRLAGTSVTVTSGGVTLDCPMIYVSATQVAAILPSTTPVSSEAKFIVTANGMSSNDLLNPYFWPFTEVAASATGVYTLDSSGAGPGIFTAVDGSVKNFANPARPGEVLTTWATGLGPIDGDDALPSAARNLPGVEVWVGAQAASVLYAGPSPCCAGLNQINFEVPAVGDSCFMPVAVRGGGVMSNFVTLAIHAGGGACSDTGPELPTSVYTRAANGEQLKVGAFAIGPQGILARGGFPMTTYLAARLSAALHARVSEQEVALLVRAIENKSARGVRRAMAKYRTKWNALDPKVRKSLLDSVDQTQDGAGASFFNLGSSGSLMSVLTSVFPPQGACVITGDIPGRLSANSIALDAGSSLNLGGPVGQAFMTAQKKGQYSVLFGGAYTGPGVPPGVYTISGSGGKDVGPFSVTLEVRSAITWTNRPSSGTAIDASQPLTFTWVGGTIPRHVLIGGSQGGKETFLCSEDTAKGSFTIPPVFLSGLESGKQVTLFIGQHPLERKVSIPGMDIVYFADASSNSVAVPVR